MDLKNIEPSVILVFYLLPLFILFLSDRLLMYLLYKELRTYPLRKALIPFIITIITYIGATIFLLLHDDPNNLDLAIINEILLKISQGILWAISIYIILNIIYLIYQFIFRKPKKTITAGKIVLLYFIALTVAVMHMFYFGF